MFSTAPLGGFISIVNSSFVVSAVPEAVIPPVELQSIPPAAVIAVPFSRCMSHTVISAFSFSSSSESLSLLPSHETDQGRSFRYWFLSAYEMIVTDSAPAETSGSVPESSDV